MHPEPDPSQDAEPDTAHLGGSWRSQAAHYSGIGIQAAAVLVAFVLLGRQADRWLELKRPLLTAAAALLGCVSVVVWLIYKLSPRRR